ncbi:hypothetical protein L0337_42890 [candidate division KSB1 bacterium]|nr:hypothetical protein [candidate division KSB1 bacterium]
MAKFFLLMAVLILGANDLFAQRKNQIEFYAGAAFPLSPDDFKEYTRVGLSGNAQYVIFPSPRLGITLNIGYESFSVDNAKFTNALSTQLTGQPASYWASLDLTTPTGTVRINPSSDISARLIRFGGGLRPYLTAPEANTQIFLLAQANYNLINNKYSATDLPYDYDPTTTILQWATFDDDTWEQTIGENDENVVGFGLGGGLEIPAGESFNVVLQGLFNIISTKGESTSFVGVTVGLVF